ncbi:F-box/kelch-repeat protein At1g57790-like [Papaver somniferum]|uniref:F-box/kelch-repeat protein At1g57790-like n=1 Tax=Papaver somniferum TaxID=3469 RepID=UPI000E702DF1|nr:F-box/kelch-repeat protein At1g57790-like [Papaver somniferum]
MTEFCLRTQAINNLNNKPWSDLPPELLLEIAGKLGLLEHLSFRGVCQPWRLASSEASADLQSEIDTKPWFLLYGNGSHCSLLDSLSDKVYNIHMPELDGATCIASKEGWLLLYRNESLFFYRPYSHAKIELPKFPTQQLFDDHTATFSSTPISPDCMVFIGTRTSSTHLVLNVLRRGANVWVQYEETIYGPDPNFTFMTFCSSGEFCSGGELNLVSKTRNVIFSVEEKRWMHRVLVPSNTPGSSPVPWENRDPKIELKRKLGLGKGDSLTICGTEMIGEHNTCISNQEIKAVEEEGVDIRHNKGVWINPQFFQLPLNQNSWSL